MSTIDPAYQGPETLAPPDDSSDGAILKRIRDRFDYHLRAWKDIRDEGDKDMQALSPDGPWDSVEREARKKAQRPCIHLDQLEQHTNNLINEVRQNPIAIKVIPGSNGAKPEEAELRGDRIRQIEYESNANQAYIAAFENAAQRSYGVFGVITEEIEWDSFDQRIKIRRFPNPNAVSWDPDCREADFSDMQDAFVWNRYRLDDYKRLYPNSSITNFGISEMSLAPNWIDTQSVQVAEYWCYEQKERKMFLLEDGSPTGLKMFSDELPQGTKRTIKTITYPDGGPTFPILQTKKAVERTVMQYLTNGVEILDRTTWLGKWIPIFPVVGKEKYVRRTGNKTERILESYIRKGRDGQMLFDYYKSSEAEVVGMTPKTPYVMYEGQEATNTPWDRINKEPLGFATVKAHTDEGGADMLPLPRREAFEPPIQALEIGAESARRAIQAAVGSYGYTKLDDTNVKSGKAINALDKQADMGSFHFIDNFKVAIQHCGEVINDLLDKIEVGPRDVGIRKLNGTNEIVHINEPYHDDNGELKDFRYSSSPEAKFNVLITTGKPYETLREAAKDFNSNLIGSRLPGVERLLDLMIKLEDLGPLGDEMAERVTPPEFKKDAKGPNPQEVQQIIQQYEAALTDAMKQLEAYKADLPKIQAEKEMKSAEIDSKERIAQSQLELEALKVRLEIVKTQMTNASKESIELLKAQVSTINNELDVKAAGHQQERSQEHEKDLTRMTHQHEAVQSQEDRKLAKEIKPKPTVKK